MSKLTQTLDDLAKEVEYPAAWKPEPGKTLTGIAVRWDHVVIERKDEDPRPCAVLVLRDVKGTEHGVWTWHKVLQNELIDKAEPGDFVAVNYRGERPRQSGDGSYHGYRVAIKKKTDGNEDIPF